MLQPSLVEPCAEVALRCLKMHISRFENGEAVFLIFVGSGRCFLVKCPRTPKSYTTDFRPLFERKCKLSVSPLFTINKFPHVHAVPYICTSAY